MRLALFSSARVVVVALSGHACEALVGVMPSVALFRHFFQPRVGKEGWLAGGVTFCFHQNVKQFYPQMVVKSKWEEWRNSWFLVAIPEALECL